MKAIIYKKYGGPEQLHPADVAKPVPAKNEVLVKVYACSVNDWDWGKLEKNFFNSLFSGFGKPKHQILGSDIAGIVEEVGKEVTKFKPGDEVYGDLSGKWGGFAEYVCASEKQLASKPKQMSFEQAAAIPQAGMLAVQGLIDVGKIQEGQKLLINGAGGGVGTLGLQIVKQYGVEVTVVDIAAKLEMLRNLGAKNVIDYTQQDFTGSRELYDLVIDTKTNRPILRYLRVLKPGGKYVTVGGSIPLLLQLLILIPFISIFSKKKVRLVMLKPNKDLDYMSKLFKSGKLIPVIDGYYSLEQTPEAFKVFGEARHKGKLVISIVNGNQ